MARPVQQPIRSAQQASPQGKERKEGGKDRRETPDCTSSHLLTHQEDFGAWDQAGLSQGSLQLCV